jgi:hypothetical protein
MTVFKKSMTLAFLLMLSSVAFLSLGHAVTNDMIVISGTVTDGFELETDDGLLLGIAPNAKGNELVFEHVGRRVEVTGTLMDDEGYQLISVVSYRLLEE